MTTTIDQPSRLHAGAHSRTIIFDNLSTIPHGLCDDMCRIITGEGDVAGALDVDMHNFATPRS